MGLSVIDPPARFCGFFFFFSLLNMKSTIRLPVPRGLTGLEHQHIDFNHLTFTVSCFPDAK